MQVQCCKHWANAAALQALRMVMVKAETWSDIPAKCDAAATTGTVAGRFDVMYVVPAN